MMTGLRFFAIAAVAMLLALAATAHQQKVAQTDIRFNQRTGMMEIAHRFIIHDAEHALSEALGRSVDLLGDKQAQDQFADYVAASFELVPAEGIAEASPILLGSETENGYIWIYQEMPIPNASTDWLMRQRALQDITPDQVNAVNVHHGGTVQSLTFTSDTGALPVRFDAGDRG